MGASVSVYWPGITNEQTDAQPGFWNDDKAWGNWMAEREHHDDVKQAMRDLGVAELLTFTTEGVADDEVDWVSPAGLERAAMRLRELVLAEDPRVQRIVQTYALSANDCDPIHEELARDLEDIAKIAGFASEQGASQVTLEVNW